ncbi:MAG: DNA topoisomerase IV subunit A [Planctomycetes bacterium]|nr:DNA topoisomerase IV subunit A [Planctomycetota bacterium]
MALLDPLLRRHFIRYASYVVLERAIPDLRDGLKPVQRRILHTLWQMDDGRFHKVANVIGETMKLHPHGDAAIGDALVALANRGFLIERQGNFGNPLTGHGAAAPRYIECRLTPFAREHLFAKHLTRFQASYDGRNEEPVVLPVRLPLLLMLGAEGIAVGMNTRILPHNPCELIEAQIGMLQGKPPRVVPDFPSGGLMDASGYDDGRGSVVVRAWIEPQGDHALVIREIPHGTTTESVVDSIVQAASEGKLKIRGIDDFTTEQCEIVVRLHDGADAHGVKQQLYAHTQCQQTISSAILAIVDGKPLDLTVTMVLAFLTDQLLDLLRRDLDHQIATLTDDHHWLTLERLFIEHRVYRRLEDAETSDAVRHEVRAGLRPFEPFFVRPLDERDVDHLLGLHIRRISLFDLEKSHRDEERIVKAIAATKRKLEQLRATAIRYLRSVLEEFEEHWPRRTRLTTIVDVDKGEATHKGLTMAFEPETGFFGTKIKSEHHRTRVSPYDRVLIVCDDTSFVVTGPVERVLLRHPILHLCVLPPGKEYSFTVVYRDLVGVAYAKRIRIAKSARAAQGRALPDGVDRFEFWTLDERPGRVHLEFVAQPWQVVKEGKYSLNDLPASAAGEKGIRLAPWPVAKIVRLTDAPANG